MRFTINLAMLLAVASATFNAPPAVANPDRIPAAISHGTSSPGQRFPISVPHGIGPTCLPSQGCGQQ